MKQLTRSAAVALAALAALALAACGPADLSAERAAFRSVIGNARPEASLHVGGILLGIARQASDDGDDARLLHAIRAIDLEVYPLAAHAGAVTSAATPAMPGWEPVLRAKDRDGFVQVLVRSKHGRIHGMLVVARDEHEVALIRIEGDIEELVEAALRDRGDGDRDGAVIQVASSVRHDAESHR